jgi:hypothetical protein
VQEQVNIYEAAEILDRYRGPLSYHEAVLIAQAYVAQATEQYDRAMEIREKLAHQIATQLYNRPIGRGQKAPSWSSCLRKGGRQADEDPNVYEKVGASKVQYDIAGTYAQLATAIAAGANIEYVSPLAPSQ